MLSKLREIAKTWGGDIVELSHEDFLAREEEETFSVAPFVNDDLGVDYNRKEVVFSSKRPPTWCAVVHELGHVFACSEEPLESNEFAFFGWEYILAKRIGGAQEWCAANKDYGVGDFQEFGSISKKRTAGRSC